MNKRAADRILGATIRPVYRTHGLAPARESGGTETVVEVTDAYSLTVLTDAGNLYTNGDFTIVRYAEGA